MEKKLDRDKIRKLLEKIKNGSASIEEGMATLKSLPFEDIGFAKLDSHRALRTGFPEVIFCQGKTIDQIIKIIVKLSENHKTILATRAGNEVYEKVIEIRSDAIYNEAARLIIIGDYQKNITDGKILIITAGTADIPVAEEAAITAEVMGNKVERLFDAGVAGVHRIFHNLDQINNASVIIAVAGMEGALPSIIGGLSGVPVIAVPTSIGYGASFNGLSALLTMLNSCAPGVVVVNIDNGFGAGYVAGMINLRSIKD